MTWSDTELFLKWRDEGDEGSLTALEARIRGCGSLLGMCRRLSEGLDGHEAEDIWQQAWWRATRYADSFQAQDRRFRPWFARILRNAFCDLMQRQAQRPEVGGLQARLVASGASPERQVGIRSDVRRAVESLAPGRAKVVRLYLEGRSHGEIALALDISEANSRQQARRGLQQVRAMLDDWRQEGR